MFERGKVVKLSFSDANDKRVKSRTHQSFAKDADINNIMGRYQKTGVLVDPLSVRCPRRPNFGDFSDIGDMTQQVNRIREAERSFMCLPASVREKFGNDVAELLDFVSNPENVKEAVALKLLPDSYLPKDEPAKLAEPVTPVIPAS